MIKQFYTLFLSCVFFMVPISNSLAGTTPSLRFEKPKVDGEVFDEATRDMIIDQKGFLWLSTNNGLVRYDGYTLKRFQHDPNNLYSISGNRARAILEDSNGHLWIGTFGAGLNHFNPETEVFSHFLFDKFKEASIVHLYEDKLGNIWLSTVKHGLFKFEPKSGNYTHYLNIDDEPGSIANNTVLQVVEDPIGNLWVATNNGLDYFDQEKQVFMHYRSKDNDTTSLSNNMVNTIYYDHSGKLWVGTHRGLNLFNPLTNNFQRYFPDEKNTYQRTDENSIKAIHEDLSGVFWVGTLDGGLKVFDPKKSTFISHRYKENDPHSLLSNRISRQGIIEDRSGLLWIRTDSGINQLNLLANRFTNYRHDENNPASLSDNRIQGIYEDSDEQLWVGTNDSGLNLFEEENNQFIKYRFKPEDSKSISSDRILSVLVDRDKTLWVGTNKGLNRREKNQQGFTRYRFDPVNLIGDDRIVGLLEDHQGLIWIATSNGLRQYDKSKNSFKLFSHNPEVADSLVSQSITFIYEDLSQRLWIGTASGLDLYHPDTDKFTHFKHDPQSNSSLSKNAIRFIHQSKDGYFWIGFTNGGFDRVDFKTLKFKYYGKEDGLASEFTRQIVEDENGYFWFTTDVGISRFDAQEELFENFFPEDGALGKFGYWSSATKRSNGELVFGSFNGLVSLDPDNFPRGLSATSSHPQVNLTEFLVFNRNAPLLSNSSLTKENSKEERGQNKSFYLKKSISHSQEIVLSHNESIFSFEFSALDFLVPNKIQYAYQLIGVDKDWVNTSANKRFATYMNIPAGEYQFKVKASNKNGVWSDYTRTLKVIILPPLWLTWWAKLIYVLFSLIVLVSFYYFRTSSLRKRALTLEKKVEQRTQELILEKSAVEQRTKELAQEKQVVEQLLSQKMEEFANVSHEFRTPLTLILGPVESILKSKVSGVTKTKLGVIKRNGFRLLRMVDQLLHMEEFKVKRALTQTPHNIKSIIEVIVQSFKPLMESKNIQLETGQVDDIWSLYTPDAFEKILLNLISNAFKYTPVNGRITVSAIRQNEHQFILTVADTGIGIAKEQQTKIFERYQRVQNENSERITGSGIGLALVKELVEAHSGQVKLDSELGKGSIFQVLINHETENLNNLKNANQYINTEMVNLELESLIKQSSEDINQYPIKVSKTANKHEPVILVIEDNPDMRGYISSILSSTYRIIMAVDGIQGVELAVKEVPDFIISDVMMPGRNGFEVSRLLKLNNITSHIPIILLTAKNDKQSRIRGWKENIDDYLSKPFDADELLIRISNLLSIRKLLQQRFIQQLQSHNEVSQEKNVTEDENETSTEQAFLQKFDLLISEQINNQNLRIVTIASAMHMTERQLFRKFKALLNTTPADYLRNRRLEKAINLINQGINIGEVAYLVGFSSHSNFNRCFKARYGKTPTGYRAMNDVK